MIIRKLYLLACIFSLATCQLNIQPTPSQQNNPYAGLQYGSGSGGYQSGGSGGNLNMNEYQERMGYRTGGQPDGFNGQNNFNRAVINQPITPYNNTNQVSTNKGVTIQFQLRGYSNPSSALPSSNFCTCPAGQTCSTLKRSPRCSFAFTFIISTPDESVRYLATDFVYLDRNGQLPQESQNIWSQNYMVQLSSKPSAIDVFAHHLGDVISQSGSLLAIDTLTHVDTFVIPLSDTLPAVDGVQNMNQQRTYQGKLLGTSLTISFSVSCSGQLIGPDCDMTCRPSPITNNVAACVSNTTGFFSICSYITGGQVDSCKNCPWGIREGTYCQDDRGSVLNPKEAGLVGTGYQTATVILSIITVILLLLLCATAFFTCVRNRRPSEKEMTTFKKSDDREPLNRASYRSSEGPVIQPRQAMMPPPPEAKPIKSALRQPYGPIGSGDTSFSSDVPTRPSRSEIV